MTKIISITEYRNRDVIEVLESVLAMAKRGRAPGLMLAVQKDDNEHIINITGTYRHNTMAALAASARLTYLINSSAVLPFNATATDTFTG